MCKRIGRLDLRFYRVPNILDNEHMRAEQSMLCVLEISSRRAKELVCAQSVRSPIGRFEYLPRCDEWSIALATSKRCYICQSVASDPQLLFGLLPAMCQVQCM